MTTKTDIQTFPVLSIDAWGNEIDGYEWNAWYNIGSIDIDLNKPEQCLIQAMVDGGYMTLKALEGCQTEDDGYNIVFMNKTTREPLFAIEYGSTI